MFYLDHCGTTRPSAEVDAVMIAQIQSGNFGNPSAAHHVLGKMAAETIEQARQTIGHHIKTDSKNVIFTSGATEANNILLWGFYGRYRQRGCQIFYGASEHKSIADTAKSIGELDATVSIEKIPLQPTGQLDLNFLEQLLQSRRNKPTLVAAMHINNEIPVRHPVEEISRLCKKYGAFFHCDGVQGYVREELDFSNELYGSYVFSAHKFYGPKGAGILVLGTHDLAPRLYPLYRGGSHEFGNRPGTQNTLAIVGFAKSVELHEHLRSKRIVHMRECANQFVDVLSRNSKTFKLTVPLSDEAAGIVSFYFENQNAHDVLGRHPDLCINRGSSCLGAGGEMISHVPDSLGLPVEIQANILRASFGDLITIEESRIAAERLSIQRVV